eukprot:1140636-Pelagomonas_calceolata.AAC.1
MALAKPTHNSRLIWQEQPRAEVFYCETVQGVPGVIYCQTLYTPLLSMSSYGVKERAGLAC